MHRDNKKKEEWIVTLLTSISSVVLILWGKATFVYSVIGSCSTKSV